MESQQSRPAPSLWTRQTQRQFLQLRRDGVSESMALKITANASDKSELVTRLDRIIDGLRKYREDFQVQREPKFQLKKKKPKAAQMSNEKLQLLRQRQSLRHKSVSKMMVLMMTEPGSPATDRSRIKSLTKAPSLALF